MNPANWSEFFLRVWSFRNPDYLLFCSFLSFQDAAAQRCPVGLLGLQFVNDDWRSWKAEEGFEVQGEEERCKAGTRGEKLPGGRQAGLPQGYQDKILKHSGSVSYFWQQRTCPKMPFSGFATMGSSKRWKHLLVSSLPVDSCPSANTRSQYLREKCSNNFQQYRLW